MNWCFTLVFCLLSINLLAQSSNFNFSHFKNDRGLSNNSVLSIVQDKDGFMWFGTKEGLNRFDGYSFKQYQRSYEEDNGLGSNFIRCLFVDESNLLWVGTDHGLFVYESDEDCFRLIKGTTASDVLVIRQDGQGRIWFIADAKAYYLSDKYATPVRSHVAEDQRICNLAIDKSGDVWLSSEYHLQHVSSSKVIPYALKGNIWVETIFVDELNRLWLGTSRDGVYLADLKNDSIKLAIPSDYQGVRLYIRDIKQYSSQILLLASESGLLEYNIGTQNIKQYVHESDNPWSISDDAVYAIYKDSQQGVWIGTYFGGINYFNRYHRYFEHIFPRTKTASIQGRAVREMVEDSDGGLWIGTEDKGLNYWHPAKGIYLHFGLENGFASNNIHGLHHTHGKLLVGTFNQGVYVIDLQSKLVQQHFTSRSTAGLLQSDFFYTFYETKRYGLLCATGRGIYRFDVIKGAFSKFDLVPSSVFYTSIFEDSQGNIWFTSWREGLYRLDNSERLYHYNALLNDDILRSNRTNRVYEDTKGNIWIATELGLSILDRHHRLIKHITSKNGLPSNIVLTFQEDNQRHMWVSTSNGILSMDIDRYRMTNYPSEFGFAGLQFNYNASLWNRDGILYLGTTNGFVRFNPDSLRSLFYTVEKVPIYFTDLKRASVSIPLQKIALDGKKGSYRYQKQIFSVHESSIEVQFAALNYAEVSTMSYAYYLKGFDNRWHSLSSNQVNFRKLPVGSYELYVKAINNHGMDISSEIILPIEIVAPFYATKGAKIAYITSFVGICVISLLMYDQRMRRRNRNRLDKIKRVRESQLYQSKMDFFTQMAHDIKTPLTLINGPLERLLEDEQLLQSRTKKMLMLMKKNTDHLLQISNNLLDFRRLELEENKLHVQEVSLHTFLEVELEKYREQFGIRNIQVNMHFKDVGFVVMDVDSTRKILEQILTNALKYAASYLTIKIQFDAEKSYWKILFVNDGATIPTEESEQIFKPFYRMAIHRNLEGSGIGLALGRAMARLQGGDLYYDQQDGQLNVFVLTIPNLTEYNDVY